MLRATDDHLDVVWEEREERGVYRKLKRGGGTRERIRMIKPPDQQGRHRVDIEKSKARNKIPQHNTCHRAPSVTYPSTYSKHPTHTSPSTGPPPQQIEAQRQGSHTPAASCIIRPSSLPPASVLLEHLASTRLPASPPQMYPHPQVLSYLHPQTIFK